MSLLNLTLANLKRYLKSPSLLLSVLLSPLILVLGTYFFTSQSDSHIYKPAVALVIDESGLYEKELIEELGVSNNIFSHDEKTDAINLLKTNEVTGVFIIDNNFSSDLNDLSKPNIESISIKDNNSSTWAQIVIDNFINDKIKSKLNLPIDLNDINTEVIKKDSNMAATSVLGIFLPCYMMYVLVSGLSTDLIIMKKNNTLSRILSTSNKGFNLLLSMILGLFLFQVIAYILSIFVCSKILEFDLTPGLLLIIISNCFTSTCLSVLCTRIFKNENSVSLFITFYALVGVLFTVISSGAANVSSNIINNIGILFPFYWTMDALGDGSVLFNSSIIVLIGLCFLTCGSLNLRDFAKNK